MCECVYDVCDVSSLIFLKRQTKKADEKFFVFFSSFFTHEVFVSFPQTESKERRLTTEKRTEILRRRRRRQRQRQY